MEAHVVRRLEEIKNEFAQIKACVNPAEANNCAESIASLIAGGTFSKNDPAFLTPRVMSMGSIPTYYPIETYDSEDRWYALVSECKMIDKYKNSHILLVTGNLPNEQWVATYEQFCAFFQTSGDTYNFTMIAPNGFKMDAVFERIDNLTGEYRNISKYSRGKKRLIKLVPNQGIV